MAFFLLLLSTMGCQKDAPLDAADLPASDRWEIANPCTSSTVLWLFLADEKPIQGSAFQPGWKWGELDRLGNNCVLGNEFPSCPGTGGGMAVFDSLPQFALINYLSNFPYASPAEQIKIIKDAISYARSHITSCGPNSSPQVYQIDFTIVQTGLGPQLEFAVRYTCCDRDKSVEVR